MLRKFLIRAATASTNPDFNLDNLPKEGRMDLICRSIADSIFISSKLRDDTVVYAVLEGPPNPPMAITFDTRDLKSIDETERGIAEIIRKALKGEKHPGVTAEKKSFEAIVKEESEKSGLYLVSIKGADIRETRFESEKDALFIIGGYTGVPKKTEKFLSRFKPRQIKVSPAMLFTNHCIVLVHNEIDRQRNRILKIK